MLICQIESRQKKNKKELKTKPDYSRVGWLEFNVPFPFQADYSKRSVGPGADLGVQAVNPQVSVIHPAVGCHYFPPGLRLPPQLHSITALWPVPSYTAW